MSEGIQLSEELISNIFQAIAAHDSAVEQDMMLGLQYLSAITGYLSAAFPGTDHERDELLNQLAAFTRHVCDEQVAAVKQQPQPVAEEATVKGQSVETEDPAMGIWTPE